MDTENMDFERHLKNMFKQNGYLFPETDFQIAELEKNLGNVPLPEEFETPDFVYSGKYRKHNPITISIDNTEGEKNWAIAARDGKDISDDVWAIMNSDKEEARKRQNDNRTE